MCINRHLLSPYLSPSHHYLLYLPQLMIIANSLTINEKRRQLFLPPRVYTSYRLSGASGMKRRIRTRALPPTRGKTL
jgi:hypothetical protein